MRYTHAWWILCPTTLGLALSISFGQSFDEIRSPITLAGRPVPRFQNGLLPIIELDLTTLSAVDRSGRTLFSGKLSIPNAHVTAIRSVAVPPSGKLIVAAVSAISSDGRLASGLVFMKSDGSVTSMVRTNPFHIASIVFANEGKLAALGMAADDQWNEIPAHKVLRFYGTNGALLSETLPVDSARINGDHPAAGGQLVARPAGVAIVNGEHRILIEVDSDNQYSVRTFEFPSALPDKADFVGIGYYRSGRRVLAARAGGRSSFFELSVAGRKLEGRPLIVPLPPDVVHGPSLIGVDGDRLVLASDGRVFLVSQ